MLDETREKMTNAYYYILTSAFHQTRRGNPRTLIIPMRKSYHYETCLTFELLIKVLYEIDNRKEYKPYTHDILKIYNLLDHSHRKEIKRVYNSEKRKLERQLKNQKIVQMIIDTNVIIEERTQIQIETNGGQNARLQTLKEALESNANTMTSAKYSDSQIDKTSVISSIHFKPCQKVAVGSKVYSIEPVSDFIPLLYDYCDSLIYDQPLRIIDNVQKIRKNNGELEEIQSSGNDLVFPNIFYDTRPPKI